MEKNNIGSTVPKNAEKSLGFFIIIIGSILFIVAISWVIVVLSDWILSHQVFIVLCALSLIAGFGMMATDEEAIIEFRLGIFRKRNKEDKKGSVESQVKKKLTGIEALYFLSGLLTLFLWIVGIIFGYPNGFFSVVAFSALGMFSSMFIFGLYYGIYRRIASASH
jgi:MFS family permease